MKDRALWDRIALAEFGRDAAGRTLSERVVTVTGWDTARTEAAIAEYRRFLYLCALVKTARRLPGAPVDRVWQAHCADTEGYTDFCASLLRRPLHRPATRNAQDYERTRTAYMREFGQRPPARDWPDPNRIVFQVVAALFALGGVAGAVVGGSLWPGAVGIALAAVLLFAPRRGGAGGDDAAFVGLLGADGFDGGAGGSGAGGDGGGSD